MFYVDASEVEIMGRMVTFDVVTVYGLVCAAVFVTGFITAGIYEKRRNQGARSARDYARLQGLK